MLWRAVGGTVSWRPLGFPGAHRGSHDERPCGTVYAVQAERHTSGREQSTRGRRRCTFGPHASWIPMFTFFSGYPREKRRVVAFGPPANPCLCLCVARACRHHLSSVHPYRVGVQSEPGCSSPFYLPTYDRVFICVRRPASSATRDFLVCIKHVTSRYPDLAEIGVGARHRCVFGRNGRLFLVLNVNRCTLLSLHEGLRARASSREGTSHCTRHP